MTKKRVALAFLAMTLAPTCGWAQSTCAPIVDKAVLTAAQWNACFAAKNDVLSFTPLNKAGGTMLGPLITTASTNSFAGLNIQPGVPPGAPNNGDVWSTAAGFFGRAGGVTFGPFTGPSGGSFSATQPLVVTFPGGTSTNYALNFNSSLVKDGGNNLGINLAHGNIFTAAQVLNLNAAPLPAVLAGAALNIGAADGAVARVQLTSFGAISAFTGAAYGGTAAAPTAVVSGTQLTGVNAYAYNGAALVGPIASLRTYSSENIASGHQGSKVCLATTPLASITLADSLCQQPSGGLTLGSPTGGDEGSGTLNLAGSLFNNGVAPVGTGGYVRAASTVITINGTACALGGSCGPSAAASSIAIGTTLSGGTSGRVLYDNAGVLGEYTGNQLTALINPATASLSGAVPAWPNNTTTFFRGDGTYTAVGVSGLGGAGTGVLASLATANNTTGGFVTYNGIMGAPTIGTVNGNTITAGTGTLSLGSASLNAGTGGTLGSNAFTSIAYAPLTSPGLLGTPTAPTAAVDNNTTQLANTAWFMGQLASANPLGLGTAAPGTSTRPARADHVHPIPTQLGVMAVTVTGVDFSAAGDVAFALPLPPGFTRIMPWRVDISGASAGISTATFGIFSATGGGGVTILAAGTATAVSSSSDATSGNSNSLNLGQTASFIAASLPTPNTIYFRKGTTVAGTANVTVRYFPEL